MGDSNWWAGVLAGTACWLLVYSHPELTRLSGRDLFIPILLALGPVVSLSIYMDLDRLQNEGSWRPNPHFYGAPALVFPAVVGPLYLFLRLVNVEMQEDGDGADG